MPWFGAGVKKSALPAPTKLQSQKSKQIESLKRGNFNVTETIRDVEYRTTVQVSGVSITLIITLPPQFPQDKPSITVEPAIRHPWVDASMHITGCPNIENFSVHSSLCSAIQAIVDEFMSRPPALVSHTPYGSGDDYLPSYQECTSPTSVGGFGLPQTNTSIDEPFSSGGIPDFSQIDVFQAFPDLKLKNNLELLELMDGEEKILELIQQLPQVQNIAVERETMSCKCTQLAKDNMNQKPAIEDLKQCVRDQASEFERLRGEFEDHQEKQLSLMDQFHPSAVQNNLKVAILEAEEDSDKVVEEFLDKKLDTDEFMNQFLEKRKLYHTRRAKEEKLNQINTQQGFL